MLLPLRLRGHKEVFLLVHGIEDYKQVSLSKFLDVEVDCCVWYAGSLTRGAPDSSVGK